MTGRARRVLYWAPRALGVFLAVFSALFALDVFELGLGLGGTLVALAMHLIPTALFAAVLAVAWRWEWVGALAFLGLGLASVVLARGMVFSVVAGPLMLLGVLFLAAWLWARRGRAA